MLTFAPVSPVEPDPTTQQFYRDAMRRLDDAGVPYVVGGGYAMAYYTGIQRNTKDLDLFLKPADHKRALDVLAAAGYRTEYFYPFWIAKAFSGEAFIDIIYNSGNGLCTVDDEWLAHSVPYNVLGYTTRLTPAEEQLWSKAFVQDRDRFDGGDVIHLILARGHELDWDRLLRRFRGHERVLLAHVILFGYAYPCDREQVPKSVMDRLQEAMRNESLPDERLCRGTNLAHGGSYGTALREWGYFDGRLKPHGPLTPDEISQLPVPPY
ncbi:MAG: nucleotidyltransferase [Tepidisphaeraceae bacterium]